MDTEDDRPDTDQYGFDDPEIARDAGRNLPRVLDPVATMAVVQRFVETERNRTRRIVLWMGLTFLAVVLAVLSVFGAAGVTALRRSRRAVENVNEIGRQTALNAGDVVDLSRKVGAMEATDRSLEGNIRSIDTARSREERLIKSEVERFGRWVISQMGSGNGATGMQDELRRRLEDAEMAAADGKREIALLRQDYSNALAELAGRRESDNQVGPVIGETPDADAPEEQSAGFTESTAEPSDDVPSEEPQRDSGGPVSVVKLPGGGRYEGQFKDGLFHGRGVYYYRNGDRYEGEFRNDMKHGRGSMTYHNGDCYVGDFDNDVRQGRGALTFKNGDRYQGEFRNGTMSGKGTMIYANGNRYEGDFKNGAKHGNGVFHFVNGDVYRGEFDDDIRNGNGTYVYADGARYVGPFKDGRRHGDNGRYVYPGGDEYRGQFQQGKKHGQGTWIFSNGTQAKGLWENDKFVRSF